MESYVSVFIYSGTIYYFCLFYKMFRKATIPFRHYTVNAGVTRKTLIMTGAALVQEDHRSRACVSTLQVPLCRFKCVETMQPFISFSLCLFIFRIDKKNIMYTKVWKKKQCTFWILEVDCCFNKHTVHSEPFLLFSLTLLNSLCLSSFG